MTEAYLSNAMNAYGPTVYRLALCRMQNIADAEDVYQEVFLRLWKQDAEDWEGERLKAWLIRTALNRCADLHRFRLRRPVLALEDLPELVQPDDEAAELWEAVGRLPEKARTAVHLYYAEGLRRGLFGGGDRPADAHSRSHSPHPAPPGPQAAERTFGR